MTDMGMMGGMLGRMEAVSMSIGMLGQGVQMLGMNAEMIQGTVLALIQLLAQMTHGLAELTGCTPPEKFKLTGPPEGGELVPLTEDEVAEQEKNKAKRRRMTRWVLGFITAAVLYWRLRRRRGRVVPASELVDQFTASSVAEAPGGNPSMAGGFGGPMSHAGGAGRLARSRMMGGSMMGSYF
uniref:Peroxin-13 n=1 Tax=Rhizochromulina marina TaxID=1034831 RepID=A0A7S2WVT2_9STRA